MEHKTTELQRLTCNVFNTLPCGSFEQKKEKKKEGLSWASSKLVFNQAS